MRNLSARNALLISQGAKHCGSFSDGVWYVEEQLYINDIDEIVEFCKWLDANSHRASPEMPFIESNLSTLYKLSKVELKEVKH